MTVRLGAVCAIAIGLVWGHTAAAQTSPATDPGIPSSSDAEAPRLKLDEITVTAQKIEEDVRDVPLAVSVLSGDELRESSISSFNEFARFVPNVAINTDWYSVYIRGIGTAEYSQLAEQAVAYFQDGIYLGRVEFMRAGFVDVERVEVLKGPQGTLFGRNAAAGVIDITNTGPAYDFEADLTARAGERNLLDFQGGVGGPVWDDRLAVRFAGRYFRSDGAVENLVDGSRLGGRENRYGRITLRADPADFLTIQAGFSVFDFKAAPFGGTENSAMPDEFRLLITALDPTFESRVDRRGSRNTDSSFEDANKGHGRVGSLRFDGDLGFATLSSITGYAFYDSYTGGDIDSSGADLAGLTLSNDYTQWSSELRLASGPGRFEYVIGLYYLTVTHNADITVPILPNLTAALVTDPVLGQILNGVLNDLLTPILGPVLNTPLVDPDNVFGTYAIDIESKAVFGQVKWNLADNLALIVGARFTHDHKSLDARVRTNPTSVVWRVLIGGNGFASSRSRTDKDFSPKLSVIWEPVDWASLYATYTQGFKGGSYNIAALAPFQLEFGPEQSTTYEAGVKTTLFEGRGRFNLALHWTEFEDLQIATFQTVAYLTTNAPRARTRGVEADFTFLVTEGLVVNLAGAYTQGTYEEFPNGPCPASSLLDLGNFPPEGPGTLPPDKQCDLSGMQLHRSPKWTGSARIGYVRPLFDWPLALYLGLDATYRSLEFLDADLDPVDSQQGHVIVNGRVGLGDVDQAWRVDLEVKNLGDELTRVFSGDLPLLFGGHWVQTNNPRTVTVKASAQF